MKCEARDCAEKPMKRVASVMLCASHADQLAGSAEDVAALLECAGRGVTEFRAVMAGLCGPKWQANQTLLREITAVVLALMELEKWLPMPDGRAPGDWSS